MKHLIVCSEYPPASRVGGIGTYTHHIARLLAESGETVHVIAELWEQAHTTEEVLCNGRLLIHRVPFTESQLSSESPRFTQDQTFSWHAALLAEKLIVEEKIDLIEGSEYEAPLYYLLVRRALSLGPENPPPCLIHIHSPKELIAAANQIQLDRADLRMIVRREQFCVAAADALLCATSDLGRWIELRHGLAAGAVRIIPYPLSEKGFLQRENQIWKEGTICYVGRLEPRKGILEWVDAAVSVAMEDLVARFEFIGGIAKSDAKKINLESLRKRIPAELQSRFIFAGLQERSSLPDFLRRARIAVVPSRWENFPYTCMEAMSSGLPVIATRNGGMAEMIQDGKTGWLTNGGVQELADTLRRALRTAPEQLFQMGTLASEQIRDMCNAQEILKKHLEFRRTVASQTAKTATALLFEHFPEFESAPLSKNGGAAALQQFLQTEFQHSGRNTAERVRSIKKRMKLKVPPQISRSIYRFLLRFGGRSTNR
jgi:glycogen synthase